MSDGHEVNEDRKRVKPGRRAALRRILVAPAIYAAPVAVRWSGVARAQVPAIHLYAILDIGTVGSIVHQVVEIDLGDPGNIGYVPVGTIPGFADKYVVSATFDPASSRICFALSDSDSNTSVTNVYLYSVTFPDLATVTPFAFTNTVYVNLNPQVAYNPADGLFYYAINNDALGYDYRVNTIDSSGTIVVTGINVADLQNSGNGLQIFGDQVYATFRPGNSFTVYYAGIDDNTTGSMTSPITPQPPGQLWSTFDANGVLWGMTQYSASSPPGYSLYRLHSTASGLPASSPFASELVGDMPTTLDASLIVNMALFARAVQAPTLHQADRPVPTTSAWGVAGMIAIMGAAAAFMRRRLRGR